MPDPCQGYRHDIEAAAADINWEPLLLEAQILVESSGDPWAFRYEPKFWHHYLERTRKAGRYGPLGACSFGVLQLLLIVAIEQGFEGHPWELFEPQTCLRIGAKYLDYLRHAIMTERGEHATLVGNADSPLVAATLAAYNGGLVSNLHPPLRNQPYVDRVLSQWHKLKTDRDRHNA